MCEAPLYHPPHAMRLPSAPCNAGAFLPAAKPPQCWFDKAPPLTPAPHPSPTTHARTPGTPPTYTPSHHPPDSPARTSTPTHLACRHSHPPCLSTAPGLLCGLGPKDRPGSPKPAAVLAQGGADAPAVGPTCTARGCTVTWGAHSSPCGASACSPPASHAHAARGARALQARSRGRLAPASLLLAASQTVTHRVACPLRWRPRRVPTNTPPPPRQDATMVYSLCRG